MTASTDIFLLPEEIQILTQRKNKASQEAMLKAMGISHLLRPDGSVVVLRSHIEKILDGDADASLVKGSSNKLPIPNWDAI